MGLCGCCSDPPPHFDHAPKPGIQNEEKRRCHDLFFLLLFVAFWVGMFYVAALAVQRGNPDRLIYGVDYEGNVCGSTNDQLRALYPQKARDLTGLNYLYTIPDSVEICISACPKETSYPPTNLDQLTCPYNVTPSFDSDACFGQIASTPVVHRCVPSFNNSFSDDLINSVYDTIKTARLTNQAIKVVGDLVNQWRYLVVAAVVALLVSFLWLYLLRLFAGFIVWATTIAVIIIIAVLAYLVYETEMKLDSYYAANPIYSLIISEAEVLKVLKAVFYVLVVLDALIVILVIFFMSRIEIAIGIIKEASEAVIKIPTIFFVPVIISIALIPLGVYWLFIGAYLATAGTPMYDSAGAFIGYQSDRTLEYLQLYHLFGGFWTLNFMHAVGECIIAGAIASWYWVHDKQQVAGFPVLTSLKHIIRYHLGSLLFGSLILSIVQFIRFLMKQLYEKFNNNPESKAVNYAFKCVNCLLGCFERFIKFLDKNAYIMIAVYGYSFCHAARRGFELVASNALRVTTLNIVAAFLIFLGKLFVCMLTTLIAFIVMSKEAQSGVDNYDFMLPLIAISIISYAIAAAFFSVFDMGVDTVLLCFCEDCARNDGSPEKPYYMSNFLKHQIDRDQKCLGCCCCC